MFLIKVTKYKNKYNNQLATTDTVRKEDYMCVFKNNIETLAENHEEALEHIFAAFNMFLDKELTKNYAAPSLTTGDIVELVDEGFYLCNPISWTKLDNFL